MQSQIIYLTSALLKKTTFQLGIKNNMTFYSMTYTWLTIFTIVCEINCKLLPFPTQNNSVIIIPKANIENNFE